MKTSIVMPVWNRADLTLQFLNQHWRLYSRRQDLEIVVVDNGSIDLTPALLWQWGEVLGDRLKVLHNSENVGFAAANNQGARKAEGGVLIFISNDVIANGDYVAEIEQWLSADIVISTDMVAAADFARKPVWRLGARNDLLLGAKLLAHDTGWNKFNSPQGEIIIPYLEGWCVACSRPTWEFLGGWDERYFPSDYEDFDLSYSAVKKGIHLSAIPLPLRHLFGQSAQQIPGGRLAATHRNRRRFMEKWGLTDAER